MEPQVEPFSVELSPPLATARGTLRERSGFLVTVEYERAHGVGEATPLPGWTESIEACRTALDRATAIAGELDWGVALAQLDAPAARHGLSLAFADARARIREQPLYRTLADAPGGHTRVEGVPVNATIGSEDSPAKTAEKASRAVRNGYDCLKLKGGTRNIEEDIERVRAVREAVGESVAVRLDVNGAWRATEAKQAIDALAALDLEYIEQPLPATELDATADLRNRGVDIALDESLVAYSVDTLIESRAADVLVLKPMVLGGPDRAVRAASDCREANVEPVVSTTIDAVVARTAAVHVAASIPDVRPCGLATADRIVRDLAPDPAPVEDGVIRVPQKRGLGLRGWE